MARTPLPPEGRLPKEQVEAYEKRVQTYLASMALVKDMYVKGILDKADYAKCEALMAEKYGIPDISIYRHSDPDDPYSFITKKKSE